MCAPTQGVWQPAGCVSCELVCVCVSLVRVVIICPASTHTALVSSPSLAVLHLTTYLLSQQTHELHTKRHRLKKQTKVQHSGPAAAKSLCGDPSLGWAVFFLFTSGSRTPRRGRRPKVGCFLWWTNVLEKNVGSLPPGWLCCNRGPLLHQLRRAAAAATRALCKGAFAPLIPHPFQSCGFPTLIPFIPPQSSTCHGRRRLQFRLRCKIS